VESIWDWGVEGANTKINKIKKIMKTFNLNKKENLDYLNQWVSSSNYKIVKGNEESKAKKENCYFICKWKHKTPIAVKSKSCTKIDLINFMIVLEKTS